MKTVSFWRTWPGICAILLLSALLFFLITEHTAHFLGVLPFGILLLCPLLHIFMHKGHGSNDDSKPADISGPQSPKGHQH
jgi:cbb3-type cytochrome oxidase subunit 3